MKQKQPFTCDQCPQKPRCKKLCPPMEHYTALDEVEPGREKPRPPEIIGARKWPEMPKTGGHNEMAFKLFFIDRLPAREIAKMLYISERHARRIIAEGKKLMLENLHNIAT